MIIKCPKCNKRHMKSIKLSTVGDKRLKALCNLTGNTYHHNGMYINRKQCSRCGYIGDLE